jgi:hypothetical protein
MHCPGFAYKICSIKDFEVHAEKNENGKLEIKDITLPGYANCNPSQRFWDSICSKFGFGPSIFRYFPHKEVFDRVANEIPNSKVRVTIQTTPGEFEEPNGFRPVIYGVSNPDKPIMTMSMLCDVIGNNNNTKGAEYHSGKVTSRHVPRISTSFKIGEDEHKPRLTLECPIDGYGKPSVWLSMLRVVCVNGVVAMSKTFHSGINIGADTHMVYALKRIIESYSNEDGFVALKNRLVAAQRSWASMNEVVELAQMIWRMDITDTNQKAYSDTFGEIDTNSVRSETLSGLYEITGNLKEIYGVVQLDAISKKRMRTLPTKARVYNLINFASELATHWLRADCAKTFHGYVGSLVSQEYDLENSCNEFPTFDAFMNASSKEMVQPEANS